MNYLLGWEKQTLGLSGIPPVCWLWAVTIYHNAEDLPFSLTPLTSQCIAIQIVLAIATLNIFTRNIV
jgi:hypothetical protein